MVQIYDHLWQTKLEIPFGGVHTHACFLTCSSGNVLIYNTSHEDDIQHVAEAGGSIEDLIESLKIYRELNPDVVISSASAGETSLVEVTQDQWRVDIDNKIQELKQSE